MEVKSRTEAMRTLAYYAAAQIDKAHAGDAVAKARIDLLTPVVKGWSTEQGVELSSTALQVFGGVGFVEETGAASTTAIRASPPFTKVRRRSRRTTWSAASWPAKKCRVQPCRPCLAEMSADAVAVAGNAQTANIAVNLKNGIESLSTAVDWILANYESAPQDVHAGSVPFLKLTGIVVGGWLMAKSAALAAQHLAAGSSDDFYKAKLATAEYFATHQLPFAAAYAAEVTGGSAATFALPENLF
jgi:3-(methylthio)propanoyl-CoA dehydrogenase